MSEDKKQTAILENVLGEVRKLNTNMTGNEESETTGLAFGSAQISDDIENLDDNLTDSVDKVGFQLKDNADATQGNEENETIGLAFGSAQISDDIQNLDDNLNDSVNKVGAQLKDNADATQGSAAAETEDKRDQMNIFKNILGGISGLGNKIGGVLSSIGGSALDVAKSGFESIKGALLPLLLPALLALLNSEQWKKIGEIVEEVVGALKVFYNNVLVPIFNALKEGFFRQFEIFGELFDGIGEAIQLFKDGEVLKGIGKLISSIFTFFTETIDNLVTTVYNAIAGIFGFEQTDSVGGSILNFFSDTYENIKTTIKETFQKVKNFFSETYDSAIASFKQTYEDVKNFFTEAFSFIDEGLSDFALFNFIKQTVNDIITPIKKIFSGDFTMDDLLDGAFAFLDIVYAPVNLAVNFIKDIFKLGDPDKPFKLSDFLFGPEGIFSKVVNFFKGILDFDFVGAIRGIPGAEAVLEFLGVIPEKEKSLEEKIAEKQAELDEVKTDVADEGFTDKYIEGQVDKDRDKEKLIELEKELAELKKQASMGEEEKVSTLELEEDKPSSTLEPEVVEEDKPVRRRSRGRGRRGSLDPIKEDSQKSSTLTIDPKLLEAVKTQKSGTNIIDGSTDARSFNPSNTTVVLDRITDPIAQKQGLVNG